MLTSFNQIAFFFISPFKSNDGKMEKLGIWGRNFFPRDISLNTILTSAAFNMFENYTSGVPIFDESIKRYNTLKIRDENPC